MKRTILTGILALAAGLGMLLMAQQPYAPAPAAPAGKTAQTGQAAPAGQAAAPATKAGPHPKSAAEQTALQTLVAAQRAGDADGMIKAAEDLLTKFADTDYKETVLTLEAMAYDKKAGSPGATAADTASEQVAWGRVMEVNPQNIAANLKLGGILAKQAKPTDLDLPDELAKAEKYLNAAITGIKAQEANPAMTPDQVASMKINEAEAHKGLALAARARAVANKAADPKKFDPAITEMQTAVADDPDQVLYQAQLAGILHDAGKDADSLALCDKILALPDLNSAIRAFTVNLKAQDAKAAPAAK
jgi:hypothetical protein